MSVRMSIDTSICLSIHLLYKESEGQLEGSEG